MVHSQLQPRRPNRGREECTLLSRIGEGTEHGTFQGEEIVRREGREVAVLPPTLRSLDSADWIARGSAAAGWHHYGGAWEYPTERPRGTTADETYAMRSLFCIERRG